MFQTNVLVIDLNSKSYYKINSIGETKKSYQRTDLGIINCIDTHGNHKQLKYDQIEIDQDQRKLLNLKSKINITYYKNLWDKSACTILSNGVSEFLKSNTYRYSNKEYIFLEDISKEELNELDFLELASTTIKCLKSCQSELEISKGFSFKNLDNND